MIPFVTRKIKTLIKKDLNNIKKEGKFYISYDELNENNLILLKYKVNELNDKINIIFEGNINSNNENDLFIDKNGKLNNNFSLIHMYCLNITKIIHKKYYSNYKLKHSINTNFLNNKKEVNIIFNCIL